MFKLIYFDGSELVLRGVTRFVAVRKVAESNPFVYQVVKMNRDKKVVWEREAEEL